MTCLVVAGWADFKAALSGFKPAEIEEIGRAYEFSARAHHSQCRETGEPYFEHPRAVALILINQGFRISKPIVLALLHDVLEETSVTPASIAEVFGWPMLTSVLRLSKKIPVFDSEREPEGFSARKRQTEYFAVVARGEEWERATKCGDRIHNLHTCTHWPPARRARYYRETREYVLPIARSLRYTWFAAELERLLATGEAELAAPLVVERSR